MMIAIIPARGGSKRLPKKNSLPFAGSPLICHSIALAPSLRVIDRVCVSTDDAETARIAREAGAEIVVRRPELATDRSTTARAIRDFQVAEFLFTTYRDRFGVRADVPTKGAA